MQELSSERSCIGYNVKYMASSRTQMLIRITNIIKSQIVSKSLTRLFAIYIVRQRLSWIF